jgi:phosphoglycerate dehydrogenase-like enzyme
MTRVVFLGRLAKEDVTKRLQSINDVDLFVSEDMDEILRELPGAEVFVTADVRGDDSKRLRDTLHAPGCKVRWVQCLSAGYEGLIRHGFPKNIPLANQGGAVAPAVAEHAFALMLGLLRRVPESVLAKERGEWDRSFATTTSALEGRTLVLIGFGNIGKEVAKRARAFDMQVIGVTRSGKSDPLADEMHPVTKLREILARADAIVVTAPQNPDNHHMISTAELAVCKRDAILVNVSRGGLVDPAALQDALVKGSIAAAALDVTDPEPLPPGHPMWKCPNLLITPHIAGGGSKKSRGRILNVVSENFELFRAGKPLKNVVNGA